MASAIIGGLLAAGTAAARIRVAVRTQESATRLAGQFGIAASCDIPATLAGAGIVVSCGGSDEVVGEHFPQREYRIGERIEARLRGDGD